MYIPTVGDELTKNGKTIVIDDISNGTVYYCLCGVGLYRLPIERFVQQVEAERPAITKAVPHPPCEC